MDDKSLHDLLTGALAGEPPIGPVDQNSLAAGIRLRRRRRIRAAAATAAAAVIVVAIPAGLGGFGHLLRPAGSQQPPGPPTLYIYGYTGSHGGTVTPISTATNTPGRPIHVGGGPRSGAGQIAITPDGKTAYVTTGSSVTPINMATGTPGTPIHVGGGVTRGIAITPDGKTAYVTTGSSVTPISTATNTPGQPINWWGPRSGFGQIAITPDGKTAYVTTGSGVSPISTAINRTAISRPGKLIHVHGGVTRGIAIAPDGKTAYVTTGSATVVPISTATNTPGKPIHIIRANSFGTATNTTGKPIAITPDGKTAYAATNVLECPPQGSPCSIPVVPISTATGTPGKPIYVGGVLRSGVGQIAIAPDGKTAYVTTGLGVTPISTATGTPGKAIHVAGAVYLVIAVTP
jgi:DNA-binding beta-propeller fold protein YncE